MTGKVTAVDAADDTGDMTTVLGVGGDADTASILSGDGDALYIWPRDCEVGGAAEAW